MDLRSIPATSDRLLKLAHDPNNIADSTEFSNLCNFLAREIDDIVTTNDIPQIFVDLPAVLKQVCKCKNDSVMGGIFTLMLSVKYACKFGFFSAKDSEELLVLSNEIESSYSVGDKLSSGNDTVSNITTIMTRFYPWIKMKEFLTLAEVEPGYGMYIKDFFVKRTTQLSPTDQIRFLVARTDSMESSSCLISPPLVNFLLNGLEVDKRTSLTLDKGPQIPTIVTNIMTFGVNLLQAVGEFNGKYIFVVAVMSDISTVSITAQDYVPPPVVTSRDSEISEGVSRISLNCPISCNRIKIPVKGKSCNHHQCFEFENFVQMNASRPSWRCPFCIQNIFLPDIRVDRAMVKILKEVNESVTAVIISKDGSWKPVTDNVNIGQQSVSDIVVVTEEPRDGKRVRENQNPSSSPTVDEFMSGLLQQHPPIPGLAPRAVNTHSINSSQFQQHPIPGLAPRVVNTHSINSSQFQPLDQRNRTQLSNQTAIGPHFSAERISTDLSLSNIHQRPSNRATRVESTQTTTPSSSSMQFPSPLLPPQAQAERDWRPTGRMRGSLTGQAYNKAYIQIYSRPPNVTTTTAAPTEASSSSGSRTEHELFGITTPLHVLPATTTPLHVINAQNRLARLAQPVELSATNRTAAPTEASSSSGSRTERELSGNTTPYHMLPATTTPLNVINAQNRLARIAQPVELSATNGKTSSTSSKNLS